MTLRHPAFPALLMHEDAELAELLGAPITTRETIREWPLSWTQRLELADGRAYAYKAQVPPLVERDFYAAARSDLLPRHLDSGRLGDCSTVLIEWVDAPSLADLPGTEAERVERARTVVDLIGRIGGGPSVYLDVGTDTTWRAEADATLTKLRRLHGLGWFGSISPADADRVDGWSRTDAVRHTIETTSRLVHRDLKPEHVFVTEDGFRVIDWQVPVIAPYEIDLSMLLGESGLDPAARVDPSAYRISRFLALRWAVVAQHDFFPEEPWPMLEDWAGAALLAITADLDAAQ